MTRKGKTDRRRPAPARIAEGLLSVGLLAGAALILVFLGCDQEKHYRTLSFFFDGVPSPGGSAPVRPGQAPGVDAANRADQPEDAQSEIFYHKPYSEGRCNGCHDRNIGNEAPAADATLCRKCHRLYDQFRADDWAHGPTALGLCGECHKAHESEHRGLLTAGQPELCYQCHDEASVRQRQPHTDMEDPRCSDCHDPHAAGNRLLLLDSRSYRRRRRGGFAPLESPHDNWTSDQCKTCHRVQESNELVEGVEAKCLTCHEQVLEAPAGQTLHGAVSQGACIACHTPHRAAHPNLIRAGTERVCLECHDLAEISTPRHPRVVRGDCLICHAGHSAARAKLLRPNIPLHDWPDGGAGDSAASGDNGDGEAEAAQ